ncbi:hypothetical protein BC835DRAFT_1309817 [Cytidiella melzeri]|nr:hypothetical protein BC835DRAFT_1309817 [Cytidiella melzeri]
MPSLLMSSQIAQVPRQALVLTIGWEINVKLSLEVTRVRNKARYGARLWEQKKVLKRRLHRTTAVLFSDPEEAWPPTFVLQTADNWQIEAANCSMRSAGRQTLMALVPGVPQRRVSWQQELKYGYLRQRWARPWRLCECWFTHWESVSGGWEIICAPDVGRRRTGTAGSAQNVYSVANPHPLMIPEVTRLVLVFLPARPACLVALKKNWIPKGLLTTVILAEGQYGLRRGGSKRYSQDDTRAVHAGTEGR